MEFEGKNKSKRRKDSVKVVHISTPMKVKTSASRFRTLVQELTGPDSDVSRFMECNGNVTATTDFQIIPEMFRLSRKKPVNGNSHHDHHLSSTSFPLMDLWPESTTSSDSFSEQSFSTDLFVNSGIEEQQLQGLFSSNLSGDSSQLDVLGSYDAL